MDLVGYVPEAPATLVDLSQSLDDPVTWAGLLTSVGFAHRAGDAFEVPKPVVEGRVSEWMQPGSWPVFTTALGDHALLHLVWRNFDGDAGNDYLLAGGADAEVTLLASIEGHFQGPGISWPELQRAAGRASSARDAAVRTLMLLPILGDSATPSNATDVVQDALREVGATQAISDTAEQLLHGRLWGSPTWSLEDGVATCHGQHSLRGRGASHVERARIAALL